VGGNPAGPIKQRYAGADVKLPLRAAWWEWPGRSRWSRSTAARSWPGTPADIEKIARDNGLLTP
jgi:hypothetical protein